MSTTLDGQVLFDEQQLEIEVDSKHRAMKERAVAGLDGVLSIDLGARGRKIRQKGRLLAASWKQMEQRLADISAFIDGKGHTLKTSRSEEFCNVRMDAFKVTERSESGGGVVAGYEIEYVQLKD